VNRRHYMCNAYCRLVGFRLKEKEPVSVCRGAYLTVVGVVLKQGVIWTRSRGKLLRLFAFSERVDSARYRVFEDNRYRLQPTASHCCEPVGVVQVFAVSKFDTRALYACKTMSKTLIAEKKRERLILNERDILAKVHHPCIVRAVQCARGDSGTSVRVSGCNGLVDVIVQVNLSYAFQDDQTLYLVLSLMSGGELGVRVDCLHRLLAITRVLTCILCALLIMLDLVSSQSVRCIPGAHGSLLQRRYSAAMRIGLVLVPRYPCFCVHCSSGAGVGASPLIGHRLS